MVKFESKTEHIFITLYGSLCSFESAQSTDLKIYRVLHLIIIDFWDSDHSASAIPQLLTPMCTVQSQA